MTNDPSNHGHRNPPRFPLWTAAVLAWSWMLLPLAADLRAEDASAVGSGPPTADEVRLADSGVILRGVPGHSLRYHLSLPTGWTTGRSYPVLLAVTGSNSNFPVLAEGYRSIRGPLPFVMVTPTTLSSSSTIDPKRFPHLSADACARWQAAGTRERLAYDVAGIQLVLNDVASHFGGERRVYLSGFSKGGHLAWHIPFAHPDWVHLAFPTCPVFDAEADSVPTAPTRTVPIVVFQGSNDGLLAGTLEPSWLSAKETAKRLGFPDITRVMTNRGHSWHYEEILWMSYGHHLANRPP